MKSQNSVILFNPLSCSFPFIYKPTQGADLFIYKYYIVSVVDQIQFLYFAIVLQILQLCGLEMLNQKVTSFAEDLVQAHRTRRPADLAMCLARREESTALEESLQKLSEVSELEVSNNLIKIQL